MIYFTNSDRLGAIPYFFDVMDPRPAKDQIEENYQHGGGYSPCPGNWQLSYDPKGKAILRFVMPAPDIDEEFPEWGRGVLNDEIIIVFRSAFTAIVQDNGDFEVIRMD